MRGVLGVVLALWMVGCGSVAQASTQLSADFKSKPDFTLLLMAPDVEVGLMTAGGMVEPNQDWTEKAAANLFKALQDRKAERGGTIVPFNRDGLDPALVDLSNEITKLNWLVTQNIFTHRGPLASDLPTRKDKFDWSLSPAALPLAEQFKADYALFLIARDSFSSGGRVAMNILGLAGCAVGVCVIPGGGVQLAIGTLVDLRTGAVLWFNYEGNMTGDIREPEGARKLVDQLFAQLPLGTPPEPAPKPTRKR
jgi:hypothetical protein